MEHALKSRHSVEEAKLNLLGAALATPTDMTHRTVIDQYCHFFDTD